MYSKQPENLLRKTVKLKSMREFTKKQKRELAHIIYV